MNRGAKVGSLVTGWDEYENMFLESFLYDESLPSGTPDDLPNGYWIGLKNDEYRKGKGKRWGWVDRWPLTFSRWSGSEPVGQEWCLFLTETCFFESNYTTT